MCVYVHACVRVCMLLHQWLYCSRFYHACLLIRHMPAWFLEMAFVHKVNMYVCLCVHPPPKVIIKYLCEMKLIE